MAVVPLSSGTLDASRFGAKAATLAAPAAEAAQLPPATRARLDLGYSAEQDDPAVVGTSVALTVLRDGELVEVDGGAGIVRHIATRAEVMR